MRQRRRAPEQRQHQREKLQPVDQLAALDTLKDRVIAGSQDLRAGHGSRRVRHRAAAVRFFCLFLVPQDNLAAVQCAKKTDRSQRPRAFDTAWQLAQMAHRPQVGLPVAPSPRQPVNQLAFVLGECHRLRSHRFGTRVHLQAATQDQQHEHAAKEHKQRTFDELHISGRHHPGRHHNHRHNQPDGHNPQPLRKIE